MNIYNQNKLILLLKISKVIHSTPVPAIDKMKTRINMNNYHKDLRKVIQEGRHENSHDIIHLDKKVTKKMCSRHRKYLHQLTELLVTSINVVASELNTEIYFISGNPYIRVGGFDETISSKTFNNFLRVCMVGLTGDYEVLCDFDRIKREMVHKKLFRSDNE